MSFDLRLSGRAALPLVASQVAELTEADLALLNAERGTKPSPLKKLSERHHALAKLLAQGTAPGEAQLILGYTVNRISILKADPAFQELVGFYKAALDVEYRGLHAELAGLSQDAVAELRDRLEEAPEDITTTQLMEIVKLGADRTGFGPKSTQDVNVNIGLADRMNAARERIRARQLDLTATELTDDK